MVSNVAGNVSPVRGKSGDQPMSSKRTKGANKLGAEIDMYALLYELACVPFHCSACFFTAPSVENSSDASLNMVLAASRASDQSL